MTTNTIDEIERALAEAGCAAGNEHRHYSAVERIEMLAQARDYFMRETDRWREVRAGVRRLG